MGRFESLQGLRANRVSEARMTWMVTYIISVIWLPALGALLATGTIDATLEASQANPDLANEAAERLSTGFFLLASLFGVSAALLRVFATYNLNVLKGLSKGESSLWAGLSIFCSGFIWLFFYLSAKDNYDYADDNEAIVARASDQPSADTPVVSLQRSSYRDWLADLNNHIAATGSKVRPIHFKPGSLHYGAFQRISPQAFLASESHPEANVEWIED